MHYEDLIQSKDKELAIAKSGHFLEVRDINKQIVVAKSEHFLEVRELNTHIVELKDDQSKIQENMVSLSSGHDYAVSLAVKEAKELERSHYSVVKKSNKKK